MGYIRIRRDEDAYKMDKRLEYNFFDPLGFLVAFAYCDDGEWRIYAIWENIDLHNLARDRRFESLVECIPVAQAILIDRDHRNRKEMKRTINWDTLE